MNWRDEETTEKQKATIVKMSGILDWKTCVPEKRGDACDLIKKMMAETDKRIAITGTMRVNPNYETIQDDDYINEDSMDDDTTEFFDDNEL
jgi:hypothetical protein